MKADSLAYLVEDAFLACLEDGADPPESFAVYLPDAWFDGLTVQGTVLEVAGYRVTLWGEH